MPLMSGRTGPAAIYTDEFCREVVRGILEQKKAVSSRRVCISIIGLHLMTKEEKEIMRKDAERLHERTGMTCELEPK